MRPCKVCGEALESGQGEPCVICGAWFHLEARRAPHAPACGIVTDQFPGLCACGVNFVCGACAAAEGIEVPVRRAAGSPATA